MKTFRAILLGYGRMGKVLEALAPSYGYAIVGRYDVNSPFDAAQAPDFDLAFDFSHPQAVRPHVQAVAALHKPMVIGTTGWYDRLEEVQQLAREAEIGILYGRNFSVGMQVFFRILQTAARLFNAIAEYDVTVFEVHHRGKVDSPSGTALQLADILRQWIDRKTELLLGIPEGRIRPEQLQVVASRVGAVPGEHTVYFDSEADSIVLTHRARSRKGFAIGALLGGRWIVDKIGCYDFSAVFEDILHLRV